MAIPILSPIVARLFRPFPAKTILVHSRDLLVGDAFIQADFFHALRCRFPQAHITLAVSLGSTAYADSLKACMAPFIDEILSAQRWCDDRSQMRASAPRPLPDRRFDLVIDMEKVWWRTLAVRRVRHRVFVSASKHFLFSDRWPRSWQKPLRLAEQYFMLLDAVGMPPQVDLPPPVFRDDAAEIDAAAELPPGPVYVGLVPGAGDRDKCWPLDRFVALSQRLTEQGRVPVWILGPGEADWAASLRQAVPQAKFPGWRDDGQLPAFRHPLWTVAVGRRLAAAVSNDCGAGHMLGAGDTPLLSLFGYTNPRKYAPKTPLITTLCAEQFGGNRTADIPFEAVTAALDDLLNRANSAKR